MNKLCGSLGLLGLIPIFAQPKWGLAKIKAWQKLGHKI
jgi:hypothetical protein